MKYTSTGNGYHMADFPSLSAYVDFCMHPDNGANRKGKYPFSEMLERTETKRDFTFNWNVHTARQKLEEPPESADLIHAYAENLNLSAHDQPRRRLRRGLEDGADLDPVGWINRRPDAWEDIRKERTAKRIFKIAINLSTAHYEKKENLAARAAACLAMIDAAENAGHRCELDGLISLRELDRRKTRKNGEIQIIRIRLKNAESPADLDTLALAAGELGFFRTMGFRGMLACYNGEENIDDAFGLCIAAPKHLASQYDEILDRDIYNKETALARLEKFQTAQQEDPAHA